LNIGTTNARTINIGNQNSNIYVNSSLNLSGNLNFSNLVFYATNVITDITKTGVSIDFTSSQPVYANDIGIGSNTLNTSSAGSNVAIGTSALSLTSTSQQVAVGYQALAANTTGSYNTAIGYQALQYNSSGNANAAFGHQALLYNTSNYNTAFGFQTLTNNVSDHNTAVGAGALYTNTLGNQNTGVGAGALYFNTLGSLNTALGENSGSKITIGNYNTAIGANSMYNGSPLDTNVSYSTAIGANTNCNNYSYSTALGYNASCNATHQIMLGTSSESVVIPGGLTMGTGKNITLQNALTGYVAPTVAQLGGFVYVPYSASGNFTSGQDKVYGTTTLTQAGYYLFVANCINYTSSCANPYAQATIYDVTNSKYIAYVTSQQGTTSSTMAYSLSGFYNVPASTSTVINLTINITFSSGTATITSGAYNFYVVRIA